MIARQDSQEDAPPRRRRFQFTIRGLLGLTLVVSVLLSMGPRIGPALAVLLVVQMLALKKLENDLVADSYGFKYPGISAAGCASIFVLPFAFATTLLLVLAWFFRPVG
jgi:hypothetical protein